MTHELHPDLLTRMTEAEETIRAIAAGEVDGFVVSDHGSDPRVFTLTTADRPYRAFVEKMRDGAATMSAAGILLFANARLAELLRCPRDVIVGASLSSFVTSDAPVSARELSGVTGAGVNLELELIAADGDVVTVLLGASPLEVDGDQLICLTFTDLTAQKVLDREIARLGRAQTERLAELQRAQAALTEQANHDALTGLPNRALLVDRIGQSLSRSQRTGLLTAVLFVDLDRFKNVNDTRGHAAGDALLRRVADELVALLRPMDTVARIGGDEFVILASDVESEVHAVAIGERLLTALRHKSAETDAGERMSASVGIAVSARGRGSAELLINEADAAMYHAKALGGSRAEVFDQALGREVRERAITQEVLKSALREGRVIAHYQPVVHIERGCLAGFEALARIAQTDGSMLPPAAFIPVAEDTGLVTPLGTQILNLACQEASEWPDLGGDHQPMIAVNLSARQFGPGDLPTIVRDALTNSQLDGSRLHLELTETAIMDLRSDLLQQLHAIRDLGVEIGLDDFGTGYASLTHLRRLPLTFVKIDQTFVQGLGEDESDERIVAAVVDLASNLGLRSVAEGVEHVHQLDRLRELGCDQAQGYLFARPMPSHAVGQAIRELSA